VLVEAVPTLNRVIVAGPLLAALLTLVPWPDRMRRAADVIGMVLAAVFAVLGAASIGWLFLPTPAALFLSAENARRPSRPAT